jgi:TPP-dependent pyruvate/acetoin dehydrogenase alpha subunit
VVSKHDPLQTLAGLLTTQGLADAAVFERIRTDVKPEVDGSTRWRRRTPDATQVGEDVCA